MASQLLAAARLARHAAGGTVPLVLRGLLVAATTPDCAWQQQVGLCSCLPAWPAVSRRAGDNNAGTMLLYTLGSWLCLGAEAAVCGVVGGMCRRRRPSTVLSRLLSLNATFIPFSAAAAALRPQRAFSSGGGPKSDPDGKDEHGSGPAGGAVFDDAHKHYPSGLGPTLGAAPQVLGGAGPGLWHMCVWLPWGSRENRCAESSALHPPYSYLLH